MNILAIAPHPDDETIGCGGTLCLHVRQGDRVSVVFLTSGELGLKHLPPEKARAIREKEANQAARILGLHRLHFLRLADWYVGDSLKDAARLLRPVLRAEEPQILYAPHEAEWHPDHKAVLPALRRAFRGSGLDAPQVRGYEVWTPLAAPDRVIDISKVMRQKLRALRAYDSQLASFGYERAVRGLNAFRGELTARCRYAEVFESLTLIPSL